MRPVQSAPAIEESRIHLSVNLNKFRNFNFEKFRPRIFIQNQLYINYREKKALKRNNYI